MNPIEFHFDFVSPNAYVAHKLLPEIEGRTGRKFTYVPVLLGGIFKLTNNASPFVAFEETRNKLDYIRLDFRRFLEKYGLRDFVPNPGFPMNTVKIMRGAIVAEKAGWFAAYADAMFHHMWESPKQMDDPAIIREALDFSGLDADAILTGIEAQEIKDQLIANTEASVAKGTFGAPTFYVGDEIFFGKDRLLDVEAEIEYQGRQ